jgi:putative ABC transport system permease protein
MEEDGSMPHSSSILHLRSSILVFQMSALRPIFVYPIMLWQSMLLALGQIWVNKLRAVLTTLGIVIGVASVTAVIAVLTGLKSNVLHEFESFGTNKIFILPFSPEERNRRAQMDTRTMFTVSDFNDFLQHCPSVKTFTRQCNVSSTIAFGAQSEAGVEITGIDPAWHGIENRVVTMGRPFSLIDQEHARPVCLINPKVRDTLRLDRDPTGQSILIDNRHFLVVGLVEPRVESGMFGGGMSDSEVFIPFSTARLTRSVPFIVIAASRSPEVNEEARAEIAFFLRKNRGVKPGEPDNFRVESVQRFVQQFMGVASAITIVATGIVGISLLVGGVGIMNIMLVSVSERTREIGLRKAVGARPVAILLQFLVEAVMLCLLGGLIGVLVGQALVMLVASFPAAKLDKSYIPGWAIALSFGFAASVGLIFGMFPAIKASRLDPIEALRHE